MLINKMVIITIFKKVFAICLINLRLFVKHYCVIVCIFSFCEIVEFISKVFSISYKSNIYFVPYIESYFRLLLYISFDFGPTPNSVYFKCMV